METWQYGYMYVCGAVPTGATLFDGPTAEWAFIQTAAGRTSEQFDGFLVVMDRLGADGWIVSAEVASGLPGWAKAELGEQGLRTSGSAWRYDMRRRVV